MRARTRTLLASMERRVHPAPFRTRKLSASSPMILRIYAWERRPEPTLKQRKRPSAMPGGALLIIHWPRHEHHVGQFCRKAKLDAGALRPRPKGEPQDAASQRRPDPIVKQRKRPSATPGGALLIVECSAFVLPPLSDLFLAPGQGGKCPTPAPKTRLPRLKQKITAFQE